MKMENSDQNHQMVAVVNTTTALQQAPVPQAISLSTKAKRRMRTSREETAILEDYYKKNPSPNQAQKQEIAEVVQMGVRHVHFWFQNKRAKENKKRKMIQSRQQQEQLFLSSSAQQQVVAHLSPNCQSTAYQYNNIMKKTPSNSIGATAANTMDPNHRSMIHSQEQQVSSNKKKNKGKTKATTETKINLPPISIIMVPNGYQNLCIPFYFHHSKFGIEDSMLQWSTANTAVTTMDHYSSTHSPLANGSVVATLIGGTNY